MTKYAATCPKCEARVNLDETTGVKCVCGHGPFFLLKTEKGVTVYCMKVS